MESRDHHRDAGVLEPCENYRGDDEPTLTCAKPPLLKEQLVVNLSRKRRSSDFEANGTMMRVEELAVRWDVNPKTIYAMIARGELPVRRFGRVMRVPRRVIESFEQASVAPERKSKCR